MAASEIARIDSYNPNDYPVAEWEAIRVGYLAQAEAAVTAALPFLQSREKDTTNILLTRGLWDCLVASGADVSDYCRGGPTDPFWTGTPAESLDTGFEQWTRMRSASRMVAETVDAVQQLRADYDEETV
jgi:hypothetical protein